MATVSVLAYLQDALPAVPTEPPRSYWPKNRTGHACCWRQIAGLNSWDDFTVATIMQKFGIVLSQAQIAPEPTLSSPPPTCTDESAIKIHMGSHVYTRARRALRVTFALGHAQTAGLTETSMGVGGLAKYIDQYRPNCSFFAVASPMSTRPNRIPGDIKASWKWKSSMRWSADHDFQLEFLQVLSQVNLYILQHGARYGFVITDEELLVFRRRDDAGKLDLADPIPLTRASTATQPQMTAMMALWYLGMLAGKETGSESWIL